MWAVVGTQEAGDNFEESSSYSNYYDAYPTYLWSVLPIPS